MWLISLKEAYRLVENEDNWINLEQENHPLLTYIRSKYGTDITGWRLLANWTFLMDGFNELTRSQQRQLCRDVVELSKRGASILLTSRTDVRLLMDTVDYAEHQTFWDEIQNIWIEPLNPEQKEKFFREHTKQDDGQDKLLSVVRSSPLGQSPFYLSMCHNIQADHGVASAWWPKYLNEPEFDTNGSAIVELMLHYVLEQIRTAGEDAQMERAGFLMTKAIPLVAYQKVRELTWQPELRQESDATWDDAYIQNCITRIKSVFRTDEGHIGALSVFPEGQGLSPLRTGPGRKERLIRVALESPSLQDVSYGNSAALTRDERDVGALWDFSHDNIRDFLATLHIPLFTDSFLVWSLDDRSPPGIPPDGTSCSMHKSSNK